MKSDTWLVILFSIFCLVVILVIAAHFTGQGKSKFEKMCEQSKGIPVHNGRYWECWK